MPLAVWAALRQLANGTSADQVDEYVRIGSSTGLESLKTFCETIVACYEDVYLRRPTEDDT